MQKRWITVLALAAVVAVLGLLLHFRPEDESKRTYTLSGIRPAEANAISFSRGTQPPVVLEKGGDGWRLKAPYAARADELQVARLLNVLEAKTPSRFPPSDLARFDLDRPAAKLTVNGETLLFGAVNATTREQYVLARDAVYSIDVKYVSGLPTGAAALVRKRLFDPHERIVRLDFPDFRVAQQDGKWVVTPSPAGEISQDDVLRWVESWRQAQALRAEPRDPGAAKGEVRITRADGTMMALGIVQRDPEMLLYDRVDGMLYTFFAQIGNRLMSPPGSRVASSQPDEKIFKNK